MSSLEPPAARVIPLRGHRPGSSLGKRRDPCAQSHQLWGAALCALLVVDDQRRYLRVNDLAAELLCASATTIIASRIDDFTPPDRQGTLELLWEDLRRRGTLHGPYEALRGDGVRSLVEVRAAHEYGDGEHLIAAREIVDALHPMTSVTLGPRMLSAREREVLQLVADGGSANAIAAILTLSPGTVRTHLEHIYKKLGVRDRAAAVAVGIRRGLIR